MSAPTSSPRVPDELAEGLFQVQNHSLLRAILDSLSEGVIVADSQGRLVYFSPHAEKLMGLGVTEGPSEAWSQRYGIFHADMRTLCPSEQLPLYRALHGEEAPEADIFVRNSQHPDGQHIHASARPVRDSQGTLLGAIVSLRNTEGTRRAEAERRRAEERYRLIVEAALEGIWTIDTEDRTTYVNRYFAQLLGYTVEELLGTHVSELLIPEERGPVSKNLERRRQGHSSVHDLRLLHKDGRSIWTLISSTPMFDDEGRYIGALAMVTDITRRREAEEQVRQLNAELERRITERTSQLEFSNHELEAFAYSVAHDLRAPLRSISNFSQALAEDCADQLDATGLDYLQRIRASGQRMAALIDGILALSRVNRTELVQADVHLSALAHSIAEQLQRWQPHRTVRFQLQEGLRDRGDLPLLRSVLENLLGNAWKFTRERPVAEIEFGATPTEDGKGRVYFVRDNGAGFDMEYKAKLFGVFQRLHTQQEFEGTGVGLATVQRIIRRHGGHVWGEGRPGQGATFYFTLHEPAGSHPGP